MAKYAVARADEIPPGEREELVWFSDGGEDFARSEDHAAAGRVFHGWAGRWADHFDLV